jgi:hypothetical protein
MSRVDPFYGTIYCWVVHDFFDLLYQWAQARTKQLYESSSLRLVKYLYFCINVQFWKSNACYEKPTIHNFHLSEEISSRNIFTFCKTAPWSPLKVNRHFGETYHLYLQDRRIREARNQCEAGSKQSFMLISLLAYSSILKMQATCSSEMLLDFQQTTRRYIPAHRTLHNHRSKNLKAY